MVTYWLNYPHKSQDPYSILLFQWIAEKGLPQHPLWKKQSSDTPGRALGLHLLNSAGKKQTFASGNCFPDWREFIFQFVIWIIFGIFEHFFSKLFFCYQSPWPSSAASWNWSTPASLEAGQTTKHAGAKTSAAEMQRRRVEQRGARMAVVGWGRAEKRRDEKSCGQIKKQRSLCFGLGGQKSGVRRFLFINGMFAMKIHALTVHI